MHMDFSLNGQSVMPRQYYERIIDTFDLNSFLPKKLKPGVTKKRFLEELRKEIRFVFLGLNPVSSMHITSFFSNLNRSLVVTRLNFFNEIPSYSEFLETKELTRRAYIKSLHTAPNFTICVQGAEFPIHIPIETLQTWADTIFGETGIISFYEKHNSLHFKQGKISEN